VTGDLLGRSPDVPTISVTGGTATGEADRRDRLRESKASRAGARWKDAADLFEDADLELALPIVVNRTDVFAGQFCMTDSRPLVHEAIADRVRTELAARLKTVKVGPAADPASEMGDH
jgi:betaine-aldehyde dehydrogenase